MRSDLLSSLDASSGPMGNNAAMVKVTESPDNSSPMSSTCDVGASSLMIHQHKKATTGISSATNSEKEVSLLSFAPNLSKLGKHKFQQPNKDDEVVINDEEEDEASLSLLFATSLLQQPPPSNSTVEKEDAKTIPVVATYALPEQLYMTTTFAAIEAIKSALVAAIPAARRIPGGEARQRLRVPSSG